MKIIFFCQYLFAKDGSHSGHTALLRQFVPYLIKKGYEVEVVALAGRDSNEAPCKVHILQSEDHKSDWSVLKKSKFWLKTIIVLVFFVFKNYRMLKDSTLVTLTVGASFVLPFFFKNVLVWENVAYFQKKPALDRARLRLMSLLNCTVIVPTEDESTFLKQLPYSPDVIFIRNWFSPHLVKKSEYTLKQPRLFMSAGFLEERKGFDLLIEAIDIIKNKLPPGVEFHIFGDGPERQNLTNLISKNNLENIIFLKGIRDGLEEIYSKYDAFILPSRLEGFPLVMINSLASGLPCIAFDCPTGPGQIIETGYNGYLIDNGNIDALASAIDDMVSSKDISVLSAGAIDSAQSYNIEEITETWINMITKLKKNSA